MIVSEQKGAASLTVRLRINHGASFDTTGKSGLADLTAGMLLKGGGGLDAKSVAETVGQLGLSINVSVDWDATEIKLSGSADQMDSMFDLLARLVVSPSFDQKELEALKAQRTVAAAAEANEETEAVTRKAMDSLFGSHPYGRPTRGSAESLSRISRDDLLYYHRRFYLANDSVVVVSGDVRAEQVTQLARSKLGSWKKGETVNQTFRPPEPVSSRRIMVIDRPSSIARAVIAQNGVSRRDKDYLVVLVMMEVLKASAAKKVGGLAGATVETGVEGRYLAGPLWARVTSSPAVLGQSVDAVLTSMTELQTSLPALDQLESAKARIVAAFSNRLATADGTAESVLDIETYGLGRDYLMNFAPRVSSVTPGDVQRAAQTYLKPQATVIAAAGPADAYQEGLKKLGTATVVR
jgi:zinc protease